MKSGRGMATPDDQVRPGMHFLYSRRTFWRALFQEMLVVSGALHGSRECRIEDLACLPDEEMAQIRPIVHPACEIFVDGGYVWSRSRRKQEPVRLFAGDNAADWIALGMFDGERTLSEIGASLAQALDREPAWGFLHARGLFLTLASRMICIPRDPPRPDPPHLGEG